MQKYALDTFYIVREKSAPWWFTCNTLWCLWLEIDMKFSGRNKAILIYSGFTVQYVLTRMKAVEHLVSSHIRRWLGAPRKLKSEATSQTNTSKHVTNWLGQYCKGKDFPDDQGFQWSDSPKCKARSVFRQEVASCRSCRRSRINVGSGYRIYLGVFSKIAEDLDGTRLNASSGVMN